MGSRARTTQARRGPDRGAATRGHEETFHLGSHPCILAAPVSAGAPDPHRARNGTRSKLQFQGGKTVSRIQMMLAAWPGALAGLPAPAQAADMSLARLDCGTPQAPVAVNQRFSDTYAYGDLKLQFVFSCYIIKHGDDYLLWDTGHAMAAPNVAPKVSLVDLLAKIDVKPEQIKYVGISHYHADHTGQVASFPKSTVLIGQGDWDAISSPNPSQAVNFKPFEAWIKGEAKVEALTLDKDVFE